MGFAIKQVDQGRVTFSFWEVGGSVAIRKFWHRWVPRADAAVRSGCLLPHQNRG